VVVVIIFRRTFTPDERYYRDREFLVSVFSQLTPRQQRRIFVVEVLDLSADRVAEVVEVVEFAHPGIAARCVKSWCGSEPDLLRLEVEALFGARRRG
jgi:hypothetical protein